MGTGLGIVQSYASSCTAANNTAGVGPDIQLLLACICSSSMHAALAVTQPHPSATDASCKPQMYAAAAAAAHLTPLPHSSSSSYASAFVGHACSASDTSARFDLLLLLRPDRLGQVASDPRLFD
jgi:hypothetical protein